MAAGNQGTGFRNQILPFFQAGNTTIIDKNGLRVYAGKPASGNLIASIAPHFFVDKFGNAVPQGITSHALPDNGPAVTLNGGALDYVVNTSTGVVAAFETVDTVTYPFTTLHRNQNSPWIVTQGGSNTSGFAVVPPSGDITGATDTPIINDLLTQGLSVYLMPGDFWVNQVIEPGNYGVLIGSAPTQFGPSRILMAAGANLNAVVASKGWNASANTTSLAPCLIRDLVIDGNNANQTGGAGHGLVLQTFGAYVEDVVVQNPLGDWIRLDFFGANGTTAITNTAVENRFYRCKTLGTSTNGGSGFHTTDPLTTAAFTDGYLVDCILGGNTNSIQPQVLISASAGWKIDGNHCYNNQGSGINCQRPLGTRVVDNYIERFGQNAAAHFYSGVAFVNMQSLNAGVISGNTILMEGAPAAGSTILGVDAETGNGQTAGVVIGPNSIVCSLTVSTRYAVYVQNDNAAGTTFVTHTGNQGTVEGGGSYTAVGIHLVANGGVITDNGAGF